MITHDELQSIKSLAHLVEKHAGILETALVCPESGNPTKKIDRLNSLREKVKSISERELARRKEEKNAKKKTEFEHAMALIEFFKWHYRDAFAWTAEKVVPLKIGIFEDLVRLHRDIDPNVISRALFLWTNRNAYKRSFLKYIRRYDLSGMPHGLVTEEECEQQILVLLRREAKRQNKQLAA
jgi:hypothetical protein